MSRLPNFFIVGAPKAGTTSLYHYLDQHPQVYMSTVKEPHFFAAEIREDNCDPKLRREIARDTRGLRKFLSGPMREKRFGGIVADWEDYLHLFANANNESALGEASVCYLWSPTAAERIAGRIPDAKILVMLRDPAERAFSQYLHGLSNGAIHWSFREHIQRNLRHRSGQFCVHYPFLELGLYSEQLGRYLQRFGRNVWVGFHEDFKNRPQELLRSAFRFLGINAEFAPDMGRRYLEAQVPHLPAIGWLKRLGFWRTAARVTPSSLRPLIRRALTRRPGATCMDPADRQLLVNFYREDIGRLASLLGRNLDPWLQ
ncbi:MAG TPA: sulfotransferase [Terriglobales bacterium]|nr:sulfotransferase [Terriglobales bacterium]